MKVAAFPAPSGSAVWRLIDPFKYLKERGVEAEIARDGITDEVAEWADVVVLENCVNKEGIALLYAYQQERGLKIVCDADDFYELNQDNPHQLEHSIANSKDIVSKTYEIADCITVTNEYLKQKLSKHNSNIHVLPNYPDLKRWDVQPKYRNTSDVLRIGWAGSMTHYEDLKMIAPVLRQIGKEFPNVQFIFAGELRMRELLPDVSVEVVPGVPIEVWPTRLAGLRLDIGLAPLRDTEFNRCKSNIKFFEYALAQIPGVYSEVVYYQKHFDGRLGMIAKTQEEWYGAIKNLILSKELRDDIVKSAYAYVPMMHSLEKHAGEWIKVFGDLTLMKNKLH